MSINRVKLTMFDDYWIDVRMNAYRRWYEPAYAGFFKDKHFMANVYSTMNYIPEYGKYLLWYEVSPSIYEDGYRVLALAQSDDGVNFEPWEIYPERESGARHIIMEHGGVHGSSVFYDENEADPARRFKFVGMTRTGDKNSPKGVVIEYSADGKTFTDSRSCVPHPHVSDALNSVFYNPYDGTYNLILRAGYVDRRIAIRTSRDMQTWSEPSIVLAPDPAHNDEMLQTQYYSMAANYYDGVFYAVLWRYQSSLSSRVHGKMLGTMEAELAYSYDGKLFMPTTGKPLITRPDPPAYGCFQQDMMGITLTADKKRYIVYGAGMNIIHGIERSSPDIVERRGGDTGANVFYEIRRDGFCGLEAAYGQGEINTKPIILLNDSLELNVNASAGRARAAILDGETSKPLEGFGYDDCVPLEADDLNWKPVFRSRSTAECLNRKIRIGVEMTGAVLYAITMDAAPCISKNRQISFANPIQLEP